MPARKSIAGIEGLNRALRALPKEASVSLRDESQAIANEVAGMAADRGRGVSRMYGSLVSPSITARRDRVPVIRIGGRGKAGQVFWGAEFGGRGRTTTMQFLPHLGTQGYALWPTIREQLPDVIDRWADALYDATLDSVRRA